MLNIQIPANNTPEREYVIRTIFRDFFGVDFIIESIKGLQDYSIKFDGKELLIRDSFFSTYPENLSYLKADALPGDLKFARNSFSPEDNIPVIYGQDKIERKANKITCSIDIFASVFFMLTRWEESINNTLDMHLRFPATESVAFKYGFLDRPVVNEYIEMLWEMLRSLSYQGKRSIRSFKIIPTHDIDGLSYASPRQVLGDLLKRRNPKQAYKTLSYLLAGNDPFDTYDFLMSESERLGVQSYFYFMAADSKQVNDTGYYLNRKLFRRKVREIKNRGHVIGFHPGYYTYNDSVRWSKEKQALENASQAEIKQGRQHFLRMNVPHTLAIWENNKMEIDSTLCYADKEGFRCGTGDAFHVFDFHRQKQLSLLERPLILMDGSLRQYQGYTIPEALMVIQKYISLGKKYKSPLTVLFHNSSFSGDWEGYKELYSEMLNMAK